MPPTLDKKDYRQKLYARYFSTTASPEPSELRRVFAARRAYFRALIDRAFPADKQTKILELGCGYGALLSCLAQEGYSNAEGIDTSPEQVRVARELGLQNVRDGDLQEALVQTPENTYDVVVAFDVLEHFDKSELLEIAESVWRILKPGGRFLLHLPNGEAIFSGRVRYNDLTHEVAFTPHSVKQFAKTVGFREVSCFEDVIAMHGPVSLLRFLLWKAIRLFYSFVYIVETGDFKEGVLLTQNLLALCRK